MTVNEQALAAFERNDYEEAIRLFEAAVAESRDVQSLHNLGWIYTYEENRYEAAKVLLEEAVAMNPQSHFPYSLLGEIYIRLDDWENAVVTLKNALSMAYAKETANNLGVAWYHAGNYVGAAECFGKCAGDSDYSLYSQAMCYAKLGKDEDAIRILRAFDEQADDFVGEIELAELYAELHQFSEALAWYGKGWKIYYKSMDWVRRYMYVLLSTGNDERARACIQTVMDEKTEAINEAALEQADDDWTEADKQHYLLELHNDRLELDQMIPALRNVSLPPAEFHTSIQTRCYLFGCERHGNPVYDDRR